MSTDRTLIPNKAIRRFEKFEGIPLQIINELFSRMQMPENLQLAFWEQVANKAAETIVGRVARIDTLADGTTRVHIMSDDGGLTLFEHPKDME